MNDQAIEQQIQDKGLTAPRVKPNDIEANIDSEFYFTAADGVVGAGAQAINAGLNHYPLHASSHLLTFCVLILNLRPHPEERLHRHRRIGLRQPGELQRRDRPRDRAPERSAENLAAHGLRAEAAPVHGAGPRGR